MKPQDWHFDKYEVVNLVHLDYRTISEPRLCLCSLVTVEPLLSMETGIIGPTYR